MRRQRWQQQWQQQWRHRAGALPERPARPGDGLRALPIYLDKQALRTYDRVKRWFGLSDQAASGFLRHIGRFTGR